MNLTHSALFASGNESALRNAFSWLTRIGAAPAFGSRPIGWYQQQQCFALDILKEHAGDVAELRCRAGVIERKDSGRWVRVCTATALFDASDRKCRGGI